MALPIDTTSTGPFYDQLVEMLRRFGLWNGQMNWGAGSTATLPRSYQDSLTWKTPPGWDSGGVWNPDKNRGSVLPEWLRGIAERAPTMSAGDKALAYRHYVQGEGVAPAFQQAHNQMPKGVMDELSRLLS